MVIRMGEGSETLTPYTLLHIGVAVRGESGSGGVSETTAAPNAALPARCPVRPQRL